MEEYSTNRELSIVIHEMHKDVNEKLDKILITLERHDKRLNSLEIWRGMIIGSLVLLGVVVPVATAAFDVWLRK